MSEAARGDEQPGREEGARATATGPGRVLIAVYAVFALSATARASVQLVTKFHEAPLAYLLSAFAGVVYIVATIALLRRGARARRIAWLAVSIELIGVVAIGTFSLVMPSDFPHSTVWSHYGSGYGWVPLVLPMLGLAWLRHTRARRSGSG